MIHQDDIIFILSFELFMVLLIKFYCYLSMNFRLVANYIGYWIVSEFAQYTVKDLWSLVFEDTTQWDSRKACIVVLETFLPNAMYRLYIEKHFSPLTKYHVCTFYFGLWTL